MTDKVRRPATITPFHRRSTLENRRDSLYLRLEQRYDQIEQAVADGTDVTTWEDLWITMLQEYEQVCDQLQRDLAA